MTRYLVTRHALTAAFAALALAACNPAPEASKYKSLKEMHEALDWQHGKASELEAAMKATVTALLVGKARPVDTDALKEAGYECIFGEAHETYPDPAMQCLKSFATRACQMDWEVFTTVEKGKVNEAEATFKRDCVGTADDYPEAKASPIDEQLAPPNLPPTEQQPVETPPAPAPN